MGVSSKILINQARFLGCFRVAINPISCLRLPLELDDDSFRRHRSKIIRIIKSDGSVRIYHRPIKAWEIMEEFPKHLLCRPDNFYIGQRTPTLSQEDRLQPGHTYFLLPANFFQSVLSLASFLRCRSAIAPGPRLPLFEVEKTATGSLRIKISEEYFLGNNNTIAQKKEDDHHERVLCTTPQLRKDYEQMVAPRLWKPKLDAIPEKKTINGGRHSKRFLATSRRIRRKKKKFN